MSDKTIDILFNVAGASGFQELYGGTFRINLSQVYYFLATETNLAT